MKIADKIARLMIPDDIKLVGKRDANGNIVIHPKTLICVLRNNVSRGYHLAQEHCALTAEDVEQILTIGLDLGASRDKASFAEIARIYNERKKEKEE